MQHVLRAAHHDVIDLRDPPLFGGGEAVIFALPATTGELAKVFRKPNTDGRPARVTAMVKRPMSWTDPTLGGIVGPKELLLDPTTGQFVGHVLDRVQDGPRRLLGTFSPLSDDYEPYPVRLEIAQRIAAVVAELAKHPLEVILTDINACNFLVDRTHRVWIIDLDSAQITTDDGHVHCTSVCSPDFLPPRLQGRQNLKTIARTRQDERFALAVLLFKVLMDGTHPFAGRALDPRQDKPKQTERIRDGDWPYTRSGSPSAFDPPKDAPPFGALPVAFQELFTRAFSLGHSDPAARPSAVEWAETIRREIEAPGKRLGASYASPRVQAAPWLRLHLRRAVPWVRRRSAPAAALVAACVVGAGLLQALALTDRLATGFTARPGRGDHASPAGPAAAFDENTSPADPAEIEWLRNRPCALTRPRAAVELAGGDPFEIGELRDLAGRPERSEPRRSAVTRDPPEIEERRVAARSGWDAMAPFDELPASRTAPDPSVPSPRDGDGFVGWLGEIAMELADRIERDLLGMTKE